MRGISAEGYAESVERLEAVAADGDAGQVGNELFAVAAVLGQEPALRRALTDPSAASEAKSSLARGVFGDKLGAGAIDVAATAAAARWSSTGDFVDAIEQLGALALVIDSEKANQLERPRGRALPLRSHRFGRPGAARRDHQPRGPGPAPAGPGTQLAGRQGLGAAPASLAVQAVASRHRSFESALEEFQKLVSERQQRLVAVVRTAIDLEPAQRERLAAALASQYGREVQLNVLVDPDVLGGIRVELGDDVIDGTVASRLDDARRRMAG